MAGLKHISAEEVRLRMTGGRLVEGAFAQDEELSSIELPEDVEDIGEVAFFGCINLHEIVLPKGLRFIREEAFGESGLHSICIPEGVELIAEKAFMSCEKLARIDVLGQNTTIQVDAFAVCPNLLEGFVARGYPEHVIPPEELLYTILWCTCPEKHLSKTNDHAKKYIADNEKLIVEKLLKSNNAAAMRGLISQNLLSPSRIAQYISMSNELGTTELTAMLLDASKKSSDTAEDDCFAL